MNGGSTRRRRLAVRASLVLGAALVAAAPGFALAPGRVAADPGPEAAATERPQTGGPLWYGRDGEPLPFRSHEEALEFLRRAAVVEAEVIEGSQNRPLRVVLERGGVRARAIFRRVYETWQREWVRGRWHLYLVDRASSERAAYVVARMLGFDNLPPTVLREHDGESGTMQLWLEGMETQAEITARRAPLPPDWADQRAGVWAFDNLVFNVDRHPGNLLVDRRGRMWMIDHTQTFQHDERLIDADQLRRIPRRMWHALRDTEDGAFAAALADSLDPEQIDAFLERRDRLVALIEQLLEERGEARVLLDGR